MDQFIRIVKLPSINTISEMLDINIGVLCDNKTERTHAGILSPLKVY